MGTWLCDIDSAKYLAMWLGQIPPPKNTSFKMYTCPYCGADFLDFIPHNCDNIQEFIPDINYPTKEDFHVLK